MHGNHDYLLYRFRCVRLRTACTIALQFLVSVDHGEKNIHPKKILSYRLWITLYFFVSCIAATLILLATVDVMESDVLQGFHIPPDLKIYRIAYVFKRLFLYTCVRCVGQITHRMSVDCLQCNIRCFTYISYIFYSATYLSFTIIVVIIVNISTENK